MFTILFLFFLGLSLATHVYLSMRHAGFVKRHRPEVPDAFRGQLDLAAHQKAADYTVATEQVGRLEQMIGVVLILAWTLGGGIAWIDQLLAPAVDNAVWLGVTVTLSVMLISGVLDLPLSLWKTFSLEQKFGFNRTNLKTYLIDLVKGAVLSGVLMVPLLAAVFWLMETAGQAWWFYTWLLWLSFSLMLTWAYPVVIAPLFNRFKQLDEGPLRERISALLARTMFAGDDIRVMDGSRRSAHSNAYFTGFGRNKRIVFFDTLMDTLDDDELEAVLAHELGHFSLNHVRIRLVMGSAFTLVALALLGWLIEQNWFYHSLGVPEPSLHAALLLFMMVIPVFSLLLKPLLSYSSRKHEYAADAFAASQSGSGALASALLKLSESNASTVTPDPLHSAFYDSHPPVALRIARLAALPEYTS